ncbi:hypothetical protein [Kribbella sp.]|uniref:hypothetical protein n=1 Tax=Kribbella sp. TaxID=1871183 RepID=UPI002D595F1E|nr:hypothetical protein [Kribbella sp.]HZX06367.1 hypothetical protein [Kribbella sp.]
MDYSKCDANQIQQMLAGEHPEAWLAAARAWGKMAVAADNVGAGITGASGEITVWRQSNDSNAQKAFDGRINRDLRSLTDWGNYGRKLTVNLQTVGDAIGNARVVVQHCVDERKKQVQKVDQAKNDSDRYWAQLGVSMIDYQAQQAITQLAGLMSGALSDKDGPPAQVWEGPRAVPDSKDQPPPDKGDGSGTGAGKGGGGGESAQTKAGPDDKTPADKKPDDKTPTDPVDEAGKVIDVVGKGIDLLGKVPDNLDKWITLAQHAKDLVDPSTTATTPTVTMPSAHVPLTDSPALAGGAGTTTAPTFHTPSVPTLPGDSSTNFPIGSLGGGGGAGALGNSSVGGSSGTSQRTTTPVQKSATVSGTAGTAGTEPQLSGQASTTASTAAKQSTPPMYPAQNGGMGAGGNGVRDIKPGAGRKPGFNVPADQSESERLRRQGVQSDLQGRTNGESRTASGVPPLRKRKRSAARAVERDVLDEDLWRI